jgi:hypothetical protein
MAIFEIQADGFKRVEETSFIDLDIKERTDLQRLLRSNVEVVSPDTLVISEEFCDWEDSKRRIDLLGIDKDANLVVIEIKRSEDGGHMELQALRYAAMVSAMTFEKSVDVYASYLKRIGSNIDPLSSILEFLNWEEPDEDSFGQNVRILLASADFSKELTTTVIWLNEQGLDIRCARIKPYIFRDSILADVQQMIPLPEEEEYRVRLNEKQRERVKHKFRFYETVHGYSATSVIRRLAREGYSKDSIRCVLQHYGVNDLNKNTLDTQFYDRSGLPAPLTVEQMAEIKQIIDKDSEQTIQLPDLAIPTTPVVTPGESPNNNQSVDYLSEGCNKDNKDSETHYRISSPRLANPEDAKEFIIKEVCECNENDGLSK